MDTNTFPQILANEKTSDRDIEFRNALFSMDPDLVTEENAAYLVGIYRRSKLRKSVI
jgi:hypothetical protein